MDRFARECLTAMKVSRVFEVGGEVVKDAEVVVMDGYVSGVPVDEWLALFAMVATHAGAVALVVEDQAPRVGERWRGFVVLEKAEWEALVGCEVEERRDGTLTAFTIPIERLAMVGIEQLARTMAMVATRCVEEVKKLQGRPADDAEAARAHAFYAVMHLNATLAKGVYPARPAPAPPPRRRRDTF